MTIKTRKKYVAPSAQAIGVQMEVLLCGSIGENKVNGMNPFPSDPGSSGVYNNQKSIWQTNRYQTGRQKTIWQE